MHHYSCLLRFDLFVRESPIILRRCLLPVCVVCRDGIILQVTGAAKIVAWPGDTMTDRVQMPLFFLFFKKHTIKYSYLYMYDYLSL
jgi:hypothetical protein